VDQVDQQGDWFHRPASPSAGAEPGGPLAQRTAPGPTAGPGGPGGPGGGPVLVSGQVRTADGTPIAGAAVTLADLSGRQVAVAQADAGGQYQLAAPGTGSYLVIASAAGHQPAAGVVTAAGPAARHDVVLPGGSRLAGTVRVAGSGQPVGGAIVTVADGRGEIAGVTTTAADGSYSLTHLAEGHYALVVAADAYTPAAVQVTVEQGTLTRRDVDLPASGRVAGTVLNAAGDGPFPGARLSLADEAGTEIAALVAGEDGQFLFNDVPSGRYTLTAVGYQPGVTTLVPGDDRRSRADITLTAPER
jgi:hypothetical protein